MSKDLYFPLSLSAAYISSIALVSNHSVWWRAQTRCPLYWWIYLINLCLGDKKSSLPVPSHFQKTNKQKTGGIFETIISGKYQTNALSLCLLELFLSHKKLKQMEIEYQLKIGWPSTLRLNYISINAGDFDQCWLFLSSTRWHLPKCYGCLWM